MKPSPRPEVLRCCVGKKVPQPCEVSFYQGVSHTVIVIIVLLLCYTVFAIIYIPVRMLQSFFLVFSPTSSPEIPIG